MLINVPYAEYRHDQRRRTWALWFVGLMLAGFIAVVAAWVTKEQVMTAYHNEAYRKATREGSVR